MKACRKCGEKKPFAAFSSDNSSKDGFQGKCKVCAAKWYRECVKTDPKKIKRRLEYGNRWRRNNPKRVAALQRQRKWGIPPEIFDELFEAQGGKCAICKAVAILCVDHDHTTKELRGLLCRNCNLALGNCRDNPKILRSAADYIERTREKLELLQK
jgi:hypothetical protein